MKQVIDLGKGTISKPPRQTPTMADVAQRAGVSPMTVSRALRGESQVSAETRARILSAVNELGYVLDLSAGGLSSRKTGFIAVLVPSIANSNFADTARGITEGFEGTDLQIILGYTDYSEDKEEKLIEAMLRRRPEGIILTGGAHTERARRLLKASTIPVIETWDIPKAPIDQVVGFSNEDAMGLLTRTLASRGYTRFGFIGGTTTRDARGDQRRRGVLRTLDELSLPHGRIVSMGVPPISIEQGGYAIASMLERWPDTQIAICVSDLSAYGALMECRRRGLDVPGDIAIAGFGDYEVGAFCVPGITTVNVDCYGIGRQAASRLLELIRGAERGRHQEIVLTSYKVVERGSTSRAIS